MKKYTLRIILILLFPLALLINYLSSFNPVLVENIYSTKINKVTILLLSKITNFIPFSLYEIIVLSIILICLIYITVTIIRMIKNRKNFLKILLDFLLNSFSVTSVLLFLFIMLWSINYNRVPIDVTIGITQDKYTVNELAEVYNYLAENANRLKEEVEIDSDGITIIPSGYKDILNRAHKGYDAVSQEYPTLSGNYGSPKRLIFSEFFNYTGITGIYVPYTGQPSVAIHAPIMTIPFTTLHEMAHQRGYAKEEECNFIAFLTGISHPDIDFQYSAYLQGLSYTRNAIARTDYDLLKELDKTLSSGVKKDIIYKSEFWKKYEGKIDEVASKINDTYLKSNGIEDGERSYGRMVDLLVNYYLCKVK